MASYALQTRPLLSGTWELTWVLSAKTGRNGMRYIHKAAVVTDHAQNMDTALRESALGTLV